MPELPEVETTVAGLNKTVRGKVIKSAWTDYKSGHTMHKESIKNPEYFQKFKKRVVGNKILRAERRAKNILIYLSNQKVILIHMKMTGHLLYGSYAFQKKQKKWAPTEYGPLQDPFNQFIHLVFSLNNGKHLAFSDVRKFAKVVLLKQEDLLHSPHLSHLGPEPLDPSFTPKIFYARLSKKPNGKIKQILMDQSVVSGIGNIYSDEILWASSIHPLSLVKNLTVKHIQSIWKYAQQILKKGIDFKGDSLSDYRNIDGDPGSFQYEHKAYRNTGKTCSKKGCGGTIQRMIVGGRSAHFCETHQIRY